MRMRVRWGVGAFLLVLALSWMTAYSASIDVPVSRVDEDWFVADPNQMKPDECGGIVLTNIVVAPDQGTAQNDLVLGTAGVDLLLGGDGDDCILGGTGIDLLVGDDGDDVLIGHPDSWDVCFGGAGNDQFFSCDLVFP